MYIDLEVVFQLCKEKLSLGKKPKRAALAKLIYAMTIKKDFQPRPLLKVHLEL